MKYTKGILGLLVVAMVLAGGVEAFGFLGLGDSWKDEVLLHDGRKIIVKRSQTYGGMSEPFKPPPVKEHTISFTMPDSGQEVRWTSEYGEELGRTNFDVLAVHILNNTAYVVAYPNLCLSYNKWGRPNPPYVFFRYDGSAWHRIQMEEFPTEFTTANVSLGTHSPRDVDEFKEVGVVPAEMIKERNARSATPERRTILREPVKPKTEGSNVNCEEMIHYKCGWISPHGTFGRDLMDKTCK